MWTRCNPLIRHAADLIAAGEVGAVRHVQASFAFPYHGPDTTRLVDPAHAGGAILDLGVYPVHLLNLLLGAPSTLTADGIRYHTGVDGHSVAELSWAATDTRPAATAQVMVSFLCGPSQSAVISCENGQIEFKGGFVHPHELVITTPDDAAPRTLEAHFEGLGYTFQAQEVARCLRAGLLHSPLVPPTSTIEVAETLADWLAGIPA